MLQFNAVSVLSRFTRRHHAHALLHALDCLAHAVNIHAIPNTAVSDMSALPTITHPEPLRAHVRRFIKLLFRML